MLDFTADYFGSKNVGPIYGLMLTAWGFASAFGPLLIAYMQQASGVYRGALHVIAGIMAVSVVLPLIVSPPSSSRGINQLYSTSTNFGGVDLCGSSTSLSAPSRQDSTW